jgi:hypothetical protein
MSSDEERNNLKQEIESLMNGDTDCKIKAVNKIIENFKLLRDSLISIKELANKDQPKEVRMTIALKISSMPLIVKQRRELLEILLQDADKELVRAITRPSFPSLVNSFISKSMVPSRTLKAALEQQRNFLQEISKLDTTKKMSNRIISFSNDYSKTAKPYTRILEANNYAILPIRNRVKKTLSFYTSHELESIKSTEDLPSNSKESKLLTALKNCEPGKSNRDKYQDTCKDILCYCFVTPLLEPHVSILSSHNFLLEFQH